MRWLNLLSKFSTAQLRQHSYWASLALLAPSTTASCLKYFTPQLQVLVRLIGKHWWSIMCFHHSLVFSSPTINPKNQCYTLYFWFWSFFCLGFEGCNSPQQQVELWLSTDWFSELSCQQISSLRGKIIKFANFWYSH